MEWSLRDYGLEGVVWDGDPSCEHEFEMKEKELNPKPSDKTTLGYRVNGEYSFGKEGSPYLNNLKKTNHKEGFCSKCGAWKGSLGLEPDFNMYITHLCDIYDLVWEVLKDTGTCWVNLGDTYSTISGSGFLNDQLRKDNEHTTKIHVGNELKKKQKQIPQKCLLMLPQRFAIEMINRGWILRNVIIWHKSNCMPSSAKDRFTVDFEYVYFFVKQRKYYFEQQFDPQQSNSGWAKQREKGIDNITPYQTEGNGKWAKPNIKQNILGRNKRTVWDINEVFQNIPEELQEIIIQWFKEHQDIGTTWKIPTKPNPLAHFATFPPALIEPMIKAGCPEFVCSQCGKAREKIYKIIRPKDYNPSECDEKHSNGVGGKSFSKNRPLTKIFDVALRSKRDFKGYSDCGCNAKFLPGIVLDPFAGIGTTGKRAWELGRDYVLIEASRKYVRMMKKYLECTKTKRVTDFI